MELLSGILSSKSRATIFETFFSGEEKEHYLRELERITKFSTASIRFEMKNLVDLDLITTRKDGNRIYYKANIDHPLYSNIQGLVNKTRGLHLQLEKVLVEHPQIELAFIFGSYAKKDLKAHSDIDLFIVGSIKNMDISEITFDLQKKLGREINYHKYPKAELKKKIKEKNHFLLSLKNEKKVDR